MVYDGADGHYQTVEKYLPPGNEGNILITSRNVGLRRITLDSLQVPDVAEEEAVSLLVKSASLMTCLSITLIWPENLHQNWVESPLLLIKQECTY